MSCCALVFILAAMALAGCGGGEKKAPATPAQAKVPKDVSNKFSRPGSPGAAILTLWRFVRGGALPVAVGSYDRSVQRSLGLALLAGALRTQQPSAKQLRAEITGQDKTPAGELLTMNASDGTVTRTFSFITRKRGGRWLVVYDTLLEDALPAYVRLQTDKGPADKLGGKTAAKLQRQLSAYRAGASAKVKPEAKPTGTPAPKPTGTTTSPRPTPTTTAPSSP